MAKCVILLASVLCFLSVIGFAYGTDGHVGHLFVQGKVYCDTCRAQFVTRVSEYMKGAKVRLECKEREGGSVTYSVTGETDETGTYRLQVEGDHEEEVCEVVLVKSSVPGCDEISHDNFVKEGARISLTFNNGMATDVRNANPLGFLKKDPLPDCPEVLKELGIVDGDLI